MANTSTKKVNNSNYLNSTMKKVNNVIKEKETDPDEFLNTNKKLSKAEKKQAQKTISDYYADDANKVKDTAKHMQSSNPYLARKFREQNMTEGEQKEFQKMRALEAKAGKGENVSSFFAGAVEKLPFFKQIAKAYDKAFGYDDETSVTSGLENAKTQSPIANTAGQFATTAMEYAIGNEALAGVKGFDNAAEATTKALSSVPMLNKLSTNTVANLMRGQAADTLIDTIPELADNISEGKDGKEIAKDLLKNQATNLAFNVGAEALPSLVGKLLKNKSTNEVIENAIKESDDAIANATKDANNAVDAVKKSSEELPQIAPEVVKEAEVKPQTDVVNNVADTVKASNTPEEVATAKNIVDTNQAAREMGLPVNEEQDAVARAVVENQGVPKLDDTAKATTENIVNNGVADDVNNVANNTPISNATTPGSGDIAVSKLATNSGIKSGVISEDEIKDPNIRKLFEYEVTHNDDTLKTATANVANNYDALLKDFSTSSDNIKTATNVDEAFLLGDTLKKKAEEARAIGDESTAALYDQQRLRIMANLSEPDHVFGAFIQAHAKWAHTADGAMVSGQALQKETVKRFATRNTKVAKENKAIAKTIKERLSGRLVKALAEQGSDGTIPKPVKTPKSRETVKQEVLNTIRTELSSVADRFDDNAVETLTDLVQNKKVEIWQLADEVEHFLNHGTFYEITEDVAKKAKTATWLNRILENMGNDSLDAVKKAPKTHEEIVEEIKGSLSKEFGSIDNFKDSDFETLAAFKENNVDSKIIEDEIWHRLQYGDWYTIDESTPIKLQENDVLRRAFNALTDDGSLAKPEPEPLNINQIREQVRNTLDNQPGSVAKQYTDADVDYLANLINNGATAKEIEEALNMKSATGTFGMSPEIQQKVTELFEGVSQLGLNDKTRVEAETEAYRLIADATLSNASFFEKYNAWRFMAMLGAPKTMLRNFLGNNVFGKAIMGTVNNLSAIMEEGVDAVVKGVTNGEKGIQRTKAILNPKSDGKLLEAAKKFADTDAYKDLAGSKYDDTVKSSIRKARDTFDSEFMRKAEGLVNKGISDYGAARSKFTTSIAGYLKANGANEEIFSAEAKLLNLKAESKIRLLSDAEKATMEELQGQVNLLEKAKNYAVKEAEYATFHEANKVAEWLSEAKNKAINSDNVALKGVGMVVEGNVPFIKTPLNIVKSGVEISPLGAFKSTKDTIQFLMDLGKEDTYLTKKGTEKAAVRAADVIQSWAKTLTGTGLAVLGGYMYDRGLLEISDEGRESQDSLEGHQSFALNIGDKSYSLDWLVPAVLPVFLGAKTKQVWDSKQLSTEQWYDSIGDRFDEAINIAASLSQPYMDASFLSGLNQNLKTAVNAAKYNEVTNPADVMGELATNSLSSYVQQGLPSLLKSTARLVDNTKRSTYTDKTGTAGNLDKQLKNIENSIPFLSMMNQPSLNAYGEEQSQSPFDNVFGNALYQYILPTNITNNTDRKADEVTDAVFDETKNPAVFAEYQSKFTVDGKKVSPEDYTKASRSYGDTTKALREALGDNEAFNNLLGEDKKDILSKVDTLSKKVAQSQIEDGYATDDKAYAAYQKDGAQGAIDYWLKSLNKKKENDYAESYGVTNSKAFQEAVKNGTEQEYAEAYKAITETSLGMNEDGEEKHLQYNDKTAKVFADKGQEGIATYADIKKRLPKDAKDADLMDVISKSNLSDEEKAYYYVNMRSHKLGKIPETFDNDYDKYQYYVIKDLLDADDNGSLTKAEKANISEVLAANGYDEAYIQKVVDGEWFTKSSSKKSGGSGSSKKKSSSGSLKNIGTTHSTSRSNKLHYTSMNPLSASSGVPMLFSNSYNNKDWYTKSTKKIPSLRG